MSDAKHGVTPWFTGHVKPARKGVYEARERDDSKWFNYFDGRYWYYGAESPHLAAAYGEMGIDRVPEWDVKQTIHKWRGLTAPARATGDSDEQ